MKNNVLAIGIDDYKSINKLSNCVKDLDNILDILVEKYDFENENILKLYNEEASQNNIITSLEDLLYRNNSGENLIIFYSGHGDFDKNLDLGYFLPHETELYKKHTYIPNTTIFNYIKSFEYRHTLIISDSCFSGSLFESSRFTRDLPEKLYEIPSKWALTSGRIEKVSDGIPGTNSPFANSLLNRLKDFKGEGLSVSELTNFVISDVASENQQLPWGSALSKYGDKGGQFSFKRKNKSFNKYNLKTDPSNDSYGHLLEEYYNFYEKCEDAENKNNTATSRRLIEEMDFIKKEIFKEIIKEIELNKNEFFKEFKLKEMYGEEFQTIYNNYLQIREEKSVAIKNQQYEAAAEFHAKERELQLEIQEFVLRNKKILTENLFITENQLVKDFSVITILLDFFVPSRENNVLKSFMGSFLEFYFFKVSKDVNKITPYRFNSSKEAFYEQIKSMIESDFGNFRKDSSTSIPSASLVRSQITAKDVKEQYDAMQAAVAKSQGIKNRPRRRK